MSAEENKWVCDHWRIEITQGEIRFNGVRINNTVMGIKLMAAVRPILIDSSNYPPYIPPDQKESA